jgi:hypothetical protein
MCWSSTAFTNPEMYNGRRGFSLIQKMMTIHAVDSVELIANKNIVPLRTNAPQITNQIPQCNENDGAVKGQVNFKTQVEYVPESDEDEDSKEVPRVIEFE